MATLEPAEQLKARCFDFTHKPAGFVEIPEDVPFDAAKHLHLEMPTKRLMLREDFHYSEAELEKLNLPSDVAVALPFRVLSDEGIRVLQRITAALERHAVQGTRTAKVHRGTIFRSQFFRGLCTSIELTNHVGKILGCQAIGHPMSFQQAQINYKPKNSQSNKPVDKWHNDSTPIVMVLFNTPEDTYEGGKFEFFQGPNSEGHALLKKHNNQIPRHLAKQLPHQKPGYAVLQQGPAVVHRATRVTSGPERISVVQSYVSTDPTKFSGCDRMAECYGQDFDPLHTFMTDWLRFRAWNASQHLGSLLHPTSLPSIDSSVEGSAGEKEAVNAQRVISVLHNLDKAVGAPFTDSRPELLRVADDAIFPLAALRADVAKGTVAYKRVDAALKVLQLAREDIGTFKRAMMASKL